MNRMAYVLPEMVGIILIEFIYLVVTLVILISCACNNCYKDSCCVNKCLHSILKRAKVVEHRSKTTSKFYGFRIKDNNIIMIYSLVCYILWLLFGAAIVFLDVFLIDVTNSCDPFASRANCFLNTGFFNFSALYDEPIDCNNLTNLPDKSTFICYKYTLNLGGAFGIAGGFFATGMLFLKLIGACYGKQKPSNCCSKQNCCNEDYWCNEDYCFSEDCCCNADNCCNMFRILYVIMPSLTIIVAVSTVPTLRQILINDSFIVIFQFFHILWSLVIAYSVFVGIMLCGPKPAKEEFALQQMSKNES